MSGWLGRLSLSLESAPHGTQLARSAHEGPLRIQRVLYPEGSDCPHLYLLHPPGGVVGGDRLETRVEIGAGAHVLCTTPAAQKLYRSAGAASEIHNLLSLGPDATLDWLPSETLAFPAARARSSTRVELASGAAFLGWEISCFGMPARGEAFDRGRVLSRFELYRDRAPLLVEAIELGEGVEPLEEAYALRGQPVVASLYGVPARGAISSSLVDDLRGALAHTGAPLCSVTSLDELLVVRALGPNVEGVRGLLVRAWHLLRPVLLGRPAVSPRVWAT